MLSTTMRAVSLGVVVAASFGVEGAFVTLPSTGKLLGTRYANVRQGFFPSSSSSSSTSASAAARMSVDAHEKDGGDSSDGLPGLGVAAVGGGGVGAPAATAASTTSDVQFRSIPTMTGDAAPSTHAAAADAGLVLGPEVAAEEARSTIAKALRVRKAKSVARALPGTWWASGLPKWMHTVRRRMTTKEDFLHLHAASGGVYIVGGALYLLNVMGMELFAGIPQLDMTSALPTCVLLAGLVNTLSAIPMANTRSWVLNGLCVSVMQLWFAWYVSGVYPASLAPADPWLAAASLAVLVIACVEAEEGIQQERRAREILAQSEGKKKRSGQILMRGEDYVEGDAISRYGSLATLIFNGPHLYSTLVGGGWVDRLAEAYPATPALLFHAYVALMTSNSIALLAPTLYQRRLISVRGMSVMQFLTFAPLVTSLIDASVMGSAATNNPIEIYLGFLH